MADGFEQTAVVEPVHPFKGGELDGREAAPRAATVDHLGLEQADRLGERVAVRVADAADRRLDTRLGGPLGAAQREPCSPWWSSTYRTARSRFSGENGGVCFVMAQSAQGPDPPGNAARFILAADQCRTLVVGDDN